MKRTSTLPLALIALASLLAAAAALAADRLSLFNGKDLSGWTVLKCEAKADNGEIFIEGGNGLVQTEKKYANFVLEFDWKELADDNWDSGIYFRYDTVPANRPWPDKYQANMRKGLEGNVEGLKGATSTGLIKPHEWNSFKLTVNGDKAELEINGQPAWKAEGLAGPKTGYIAIQAEVPNGGQHRFKNIYITELRPTE